MRTVSCCRRRNWWLSLFLTVTAGCGQPTDVTPELPFSSTESSGMLPTASAPTGVRSILMLVSDETDDQVGLFQQVAREQAGQKKVFLVDETYAGEGAGASLQELMASAGARGAGVILLVPPLQWDAVERQKAIDAAIGQGIKVIILARPVEGLSPSDDVKQVLLPTQSDQAEQLVAAALAKAAERPEFKIGEGPALIITNPGTRGSWVEARASGIRKALEARGIPILEDLSAKAPDKAAFDKIKAAMEAEGGPKLILAADVWTLKSSASARRALEKPESVVIAGFADDKTAQDYLYGGTIDALIESNLFEPALKAVSIASAILNGRESPNLVEVPTPTRRSDKLPTQFRGSAVPVEDFKF